MNPILLPIKALVIASELVGIPLSSLMIKDYTSYIVSTITFTKDSGEVITFKCYFTGNIPSLSQEDYCDQILSAYYKAITDSEAE